MLAEQNANELLRFVHLISLERGPAGCVQWVTSRSGATVVIGDRAARSRREGCFQAEASCARGLLKVGGGGAQHGWFSRCGGRAPRVAWWRVKRSDGQED